MGKKDIIFKVGIDKVQSVVIVAVFAFIVYLFTSEVSNGLLTILINYWFWLIFVGLYLYVLHVNSTYHLYRDKLVVQFPFRPFFRKVEFSLNTIDEVIFWDINTLRLCSLIEIKCKNKRRTKYHFGFTGSTKEMNRLLEFLEDKGVPTVIKVQT
jgi:hypothetical protein